MSDAYRGDNGGLPLTVYTTPAAKAFALDTITFLLHCDGSSAQHHARVTYEDNSGAIAAVLKDWNVAPDGATIRYTFGVNLNSSACTVIDGETVEHDLPNTILAPNTKIIVSSVDEGGADIAGDNISACILYADQLPADKVPDPTPPDTSPIYFVPGGVLV